MRGDDVLSVYGCSPYALDISFVSTNLMQFPKTTPRRLQTILATTTQKRYARWSLGFVDPPLEVSGTGAHCKISALNARGQVLLEPVSDAMDKLLGDGILKSAKRDGDVMEVEVAAAGEVGSFSEEDRSRQVS